jgi:hypothetical protein
MDDEQIVTLVGETVSAKEQAFWSRPLVLVLVSAALSSGISGAVVSFGWKASMDTFAAVSAEKLQQHETAIEALQKDNADRIRASDLALRDELIDAKLSSVQSEISDMKDQLKNLRVR